MKNEETKTAEIPKQCPQHGKAFEESQGALRCPVSGCVHFIDKDGGKESEPKKPSKETAEDLKREQAEAKAGEKLDKSRR